MAKYLKIYKMNWPQILRNVGGLVKQGGPLYPEPEWYQPALSVAPRREEDQFKRPPRPPQIILPEDEHVMAFYSIFPEEQDGSAYAPSATLPRIPPARIFAHRVLDLLRNDYDLPTAYEIAVDEHEVRREFGSQAAFWEAMERMKNRGSEDTEEGDASELTDEEGEVEDAVEEDGSEGLDRQTAISNDEVDYRENEVESPANEVDPPEEIQIPENGDRTPVTDFKQ